MLVVCGAGTEPAEAASEDWEGGTIRTGWVEKVGGVEEVGGEGAGAGDAARRSKTAGPGGVNLL